MEERWGSSLKLNATSSSSFASKPDDDVYNFDLSTSSGSSKKKKKKKKKKKESKLPTISKEDRIANILKRMGSNLTQDFIRSGGEAPPALSIPSSILEEEKQDDDVGADSPLKVDAHVESNDSSSEDSLGMEEADFEVGTYARRKVEEKQEIRRIASEKFTVDLSALDSSNASITGAEERYRDSSASIFSAESEEDKKLAESGVSQFERMKSLFSMALEDEKSPEKEAAKVVPANLNDLLSPEKSSSVIMAAATEDLNEEDDEDDNYGYDEDDFEEAPPKVTISVNTSEAGAAAPVPSSHSYPIGLLSPTSEALADQVVKEVEHNKMKEESEDDDAYGMDEFSEEEKPVAVKKEATSAKRFSFNDFSESVDDGLTALTNDLSTPPQLNNTQSVVPPPPPLALQATSGESCPGLCIDDISPAVEDSLPPQESSPVQHAPAARLSELEKEEIEAREPPPPPPPLPADFKFEEPLTLPPPPPPPPLEEEKQVKEVPDIREVIRQARALTYHIPTEAPSKERYNSGKQSVPIAAAKGGFTKKTKVQTAQESKEEKLNRSEAELASRVLQLEQNLKVIQSSDSAQAQPKSTKMRQRRRRLRKIRSSGAQSELSPTATTATRTEYRDPVREVTRIVEALRPVLMATQPKVERNSNNNIQPPKVIQEATAAAPPSSIDNDHKPSDNTMKTNTDADTNLLANVKEEMSKKVNELQQQLVTLKNENKDLRSQVSKENKKRSDDSIFKVLEENSNEKTVQVSAEKLSSIQKEIEMQDQLINGFQTENERLVAEVADFQSSIRKADGDLTSENAELNRKLNEMRNYIKASEEDLAQRGNSSINQLLQARLDAEGKASSLEGEVEYLKTQHATKERELKRMLQVSNDKVTELEKTLAGENRNSLLNENKKLKAEHTASAQSYESKIDSLKSKLDWYIKNQKVVDEQDSEIERLRTALTTAAAANAPSPTTTQSSKKAVLPPSRRSSSHDIRRIQDLERQVFDLEEALNKRNPDSIASLIRATRPSPEEAKEEHVWKQKALLLEKELSLLTETTEKKLSSLRQEHDRIVLQYEERSSSSRESSPVEKPQPVESTNEVDRVREFYDNRLKEMEKKYETKLRAIRRPETSSVVISKLREELSREKAKVRQLSLHDKETYSSNVNDDLMEELSTLKENFKASEDARRLLVQTLQDVQTEDTKSDNASAAQGIKSEEFCQLREQLSLLSSQISETRTKPSTNSSTDNNNEAKEEMERTKTLLVETKNTLQITLTELEKQKEIAARVPFLENDLVVARQKADIPQTPSMIHFQSLASEINILQKKYEHRESELQLLLSEAKQISDSDKWAMQQEHARAIDMKNTEIERFRSQLDSMLQHLETIQIGSGTLRHHHPLSTTSV